MPAELERALEALVGGCGVTGRAPSDKGRWSGKERLPVPLEPVLVVEVSADHIAGDHIRHGHGCYAGGWISSPIAARWIKSASGRPSQR